MLPKSFSVNHRDLIDNDLALANGNDLRVYFRKDEDCRPREIDRVLENNATTKTRVLFKLQEDLSKTVRDGSAYYLVYGNVIIQIYSSRLTLCACVVRLDGVTSVFYV
jgi:nanoRNase/pAp phosphatase (c-di-AMP/oligoRNAs hydrolase)